MDDKGREFKGFFGGSGYDRLAVIMGMGGAFYRNAVGDLQVSQNIRALDLGCGTGSLSIALAEKIDGSSVIHGVDISDDQLEFSRKKTKEIPREFNFINCSMDQLEFKKNYFDVVATSMALHETPPDVRRGAIRETARVLKKGGVFVFVDWSRPRFGLLSMIWLPFLFFGEWHDNWNNTYRTLCEEQGLVLEEDKYINSLSRRQVFRKK